MEPLLILLALLLLAAILAPAAADVMQGPPSRLPH
jgi:hypothetical protein